MSLILPSTAAPAPSANPGAKTTTRSDEADSNPDSFGEVLARSLKPSGEKIEPAVAKTATSAPTRRQAAHPKTDAEDLVNAMALPFISPENRMVKAALPGGVGSANAEAVQVTDAVLLADPDGAVPKAKSALLADPDGAVPKAKSALLADTAIAATKTATALPNGVIAETPAATTGEPIDKTEAAAGANAQATGVSASAGASPKLPGQIALPAKVELVQDGAVLQINPRAMAAQTKAANASLSDQTPKRDDKDTNNSDQPNGVRTGMGFAPPHSTNTSKISTSPTAPVLEAGTLPIHSGPADATVSAITTPVTAALQAFSGVSSANAPTPTPITTGSLTAQVGSSEWSNALGQHVVQMSTAGYQVAELQLNPPGLGPLKVTLSMNDNQMQAVFVSAHSSVRAAVEAALPQLRATLADNGISLGNTSVGAESQQPQQQQTAFANGQSGQPERGAYRASVTADTAFLSPIRTITDPAPKNNGRRIDTYA